MRRSPRRDFPSATDVLLRDDSLEVPTPVDGPAPLACPRRTVLRFYLATLGRYDMKLARTLFAATALAAAPLFVAPASAGHWGGSPSGGLTDPTPVPEPSDAALLLLGAAGVVIGRRLHARAQRKD